VEDQLSLYTLRDSNPRPTD